VAGPSRAGHRRKRLRTTPLRNALASEKNGRRQMQMKGTDDSNAARGRQRTLTLHSYCRGFYKIFETRVLYGIKKCPFVELGKTQRESGCPAKLSNP